MITGLTQRWNTGRASYRPAGEPINTRLYEVAPLHEDRIARDYVIEHHYSASYPAARRRFALHRGERLVGVAVFSVPSNDAALACLPGSGSTRIELGRFVLDDDVPANGESWFLARAFEHLRAEGFTGVLSFSDPVPRRAGDGRIVFPGHVGTIYQALGATYLGLATARTLRVLPSGQILNDRAIQKIRSGERGWRYAAELLTQHGAAPLTDTEDRCAWLRQWIPQITHPLRHRGNHRYAWALQKADRRHFPASLPYPKITVAQAELALCA